MKNYDWKYFYVKMNVGYWPLFKSLYFKETQKRFEKLFNENWKPNPNNKKQRGIVINGKWHDFNRINTHPNCLSYFCFLFEKMKPNDSLDFDNVKTLKFNIKKLWDFLEENFELIFTRNITSEYRDNIDKLLNKSWFSGTLTTIATIIYLYQIFPNCEIIYDFSTGGKDDMKGIDLIIIINTKKITVQVKSGDYTENEDPPAYIIPIKQEYDENIVNLFSYGSVNIKNTKIIVFQNNSKILKKMKNNEKYYIYKSKVKNTPFYGYMELPSLLLKLKNKYKNEFITFTNDNMEKNNIKFKDNNIFINLPDLKDKNEINKICNLIKKEINKL